MEKKRVPHVVILPFPFSGHVKPALNLAKLLCHAGFHVTFVNSDHNQDRLQHVADLPTLSKYFPGLHFQSISDGLPLDHPRSGSQAGQLFFNSRTVMKPLFRQLIEDLHKTDPPTCIVADDLMCFAIDVAQDQEIPAILFHTQSTCTLWALAHLPTFIESVQIPLREEDMDRPITSIPGMEGLFRGRDLPTIFRLEIENPLVQFFIGEISAWSRVHSHIVNTVDQLEEPLISLFRSSYANVYSIGPVHALTKSRISEIPPHVLYDTCLRKDDKKCMTWLDSQPLRSVVYVSFGTLTGLTCEQVIEFWHGLVNSGKPFLWVMRPGLIEGSVLSKDQEMVEEGSTSERVCMVEWVAQEEVLAHPAVGGFLTHCGWNSTLEAVYAGVPMICWPRQGDQLVNSRCVSELWKIGIDLKDTCDRVFIEKMVRDLMGNKMEEMVKSTVEVAKMTHESVRQGGSSDGNLDRLIDDFRSMSVSFTSYTATSLA